MPNTRSLPRDEVVRGAIAAIARADREVGSHPFAEDRKRPRLLPHLPIRDSAPPDMAGIAARHEFVVAMLGVDNPPFFWHDVHGKLMGLDVLLARDIALALGVRLRINTSAKTFDEVVDEVQQRRADVGISKLSRTLQRAQSVAFSKPYVDLHRAFLANRVALARYASDRALVPAVQRFSDRLGVIEHSSYEAYAKSSFPQATLVLFPTWESEVRAVRAGTVVAGFRDELEVNRILDGDPSASLTLRSIIFSDSSDTIAIAVPWSALQLRSFIDLFLESHQLATIPAESILYAFPQTEPHA